VRSSEYVSGGFGIKKMRVRERERERGGEREGMYELVFLN